MRIAYALAFALAACGGPAHEPAVPPPTSVAEAAQTAPACHDAFWTCYDDHFAGNTPACAQFAEYRACAAAPPPEGCDSGADATVWWHECTDSAYNLCLPDFCDCA